MQGFYNFRENADFISSSGAITENGLASLVTQGYQLIINLLPDSSEKALMNEQELAESGNIKYFYIPVDFNHPLETDYLQFVDILKANPNQKIHIHCACNYRASAFYAVYAFENNLLSKDEALAFIADIWQPAEFPVWASFLHMHHLV
jgi:protein tyrosine phosphatase (PTP) superfamily phosphohydrolase (DUF442 family)